MDGWLVSNPDAQTNVTPRRSADAMFSVEWLGHKVALKASNGKYICTKKNGQLLAVSDSSGNWELQVFLSGHFQVCPSEPALLLASSSLLLSSSTHQARTNGSLWNSSTGPCWSWGGRTASSATTGNPTRWTPADQFMTFSACSSATGPTTLKVGWWRFWFYLCFGPLLTTSHVRRTHLVPDLVRPDPVHPALQASTAASGTWTAPGWCALTARCPRTSPWSCTNTAGSPSAAATENTCVETREARWRGTDSGRAAPPSGSIKHLQYWPPGLTATLPSL